MKRHDLIAFILILAASFAWAEDDDEVVAPPPAPEPAQPAPPLPDSPIEVAVPPPLILPEIELPELVSSFWAENCGAHLFRPAQDEKSYRQALKEEPANGWRNGRRGFKGKVFLDPRDEWVLPTLKEAHAHATANMPQNLSHFPTNIRGNQPRYNLGAPINARLLFDRDGDAALAETYDRFVEKSEQFLQVMADESDLQRRLRQCTPRTQNLVHADSVFLRDIESTKKMLLSRYIFSQVAHRDMRAMASRYHASNGNDPVSARSYKHLQRKLVLARQDVVQCPLRIWMETRRLFLERTLNPKQKITCSQEQFGALREEVAEEFDRVILALDMKSRRHSVAK